MRILTDAALILRTRATNYNTDKSLSPKRVICIDEYNILTREPRL